jgi:hypothetical protein
VPKEIYNDVEPARRTNIDEEIMRLRELAAKMSSGPADGDTPVGKHSALGVSKADTFADSDATGPEDSTDFDRAEPDDSADFAQGSEDLPDLENETFSAVDLIDRLGDTMNELGTDADVVNGTDHGRRFRHAMRDAAHLDAASFDTDGADATSDEEAAFDESVLYDEPGDDEPEIDEDERNEMRRRSQLEYIEKSSRRSWRHRFDKRDDDVHLTSSIDEGWQPRWLTVVIVAAFCLGIGSLLIATNADQDDEPDGLDTVEKTSPGVGTCYGVDNAGSPLVTSCTATHDYQVVATYEFTGDIPAEGDYMMIDARLRCQDEFSALGSTSMPSNAEMLARVPTAFDLENDDRTVVCEVHARPNTRLNGSLL